MVRCYHMHLSAMHRSASLPTEPRSPGSAEPCTAAISLQVRYLSSITRRISAKPDIPKTSANNLTPFPLKIAYLLAFVFVLIAPTMAAEVKTSLLKIGKSEYQDATIILESRFRAKIIHSSGLSRVATADLPEDIQKQLKVIVDAPPERPSFVLVSEIKDLKELDALFKKVEEKEGWNIDSTVTVRQSIGIGKLVELDLSSDPVMLIGDNADRADGDAFKAIVQDTGRTFEYTTVLGANKKVKVYAVQAPLTALSFQKLVKSGTTYKLTEADQVVQCTACEGKPIPCQACENTGLKTQERVIHIRWK
jgi:hypothetical protein